MEQSFSTPFATSQIHDAAVGTHAGVRTAFLNSLEGIKCVPDSEQSWTTSIFLTPPRYIAVSYEIISERLNLRHNLASWTNLAEGVLDTIEDALITDFAYCAIALGNQKHTNSSVITRHFLDGSTLSLNGTIVNILQSFLNSTSPEERAVQMTVEIAFVADTERDKTSKNNIAVFVSIKAADLIAELGGPKPELVFPTAYGEIDLHISQQYFDKLLSKGKSMQRVLEPKFDPTWYYKIKQFPLNHRHSADLDTIADYIPAAIEKINSTTSVGREVKERLRDFYKKYPDSFTFYQLYKITFRIPFDLLRSDKNLSNLIKHVLNEIDSRLQRNSDKFELRVASQRLHVQTQLPYQVLPRKIDMRKLSVYDVLKQDIMEFAATVASSSDVYSFQLMLGCGYTPQQFPAWNAVLTYKTAGQQVPPIAALFDFIEYIKGSDTIMSSPHATPMCAVSALERPLFHVGNYLAMRGGLNVADYGRGPITTQINRMLNKAAVISPTNKISSGYITFNPVIGSSPTPEDVQLTSIVVNTLTSGQYSVRHAPISVDVDKIESFECYAITHNLPHTANNPWSVLKCENKSLRSHILRAFGKVLEEKERHEIAASFEVYQGDTGLHVRIVVMPLTVQLFVATDTPQRHAPLTYTANICFYHNDLDADMTNTNSAIPVEYKPSAMLPYSSLAGAECRTTMLEKTFQIRHESQYPTAYRLVAKLGGCDTGVHAPLNIHQTIHTVFLNTSGGDARDIKDVRELLLHLLETTVSPSFSFLRLYSDSENWDDTFAVYGKDKHDEMVHVVKHWLKIIYQQATLPQAIVLSCCHFQYGPYLEIFTHNAK